MTSETTLVTVDEAIKNIKTEDIAAVWVPIEEVQPWVKNPRRNDKAIKPVADSIKRLGFGSPILARAANKQIIAGHTRIQAAILLGLTRVPVRYVDVSEEDAALLAIADNKLGEIATWNDDMLADILKELRAKEVDLLTGSGLSEADIRRLIGSGGSAGTDPGAGALPDVPFSKPGEVYQLGPHRLMCGSSTVEDDVNKLFGDEKASWMVADAPFGVSVVGGFRETSVKDRLADGELTIENDDIEGLPILLKSAFALADSVLTDGSPFYIFHPQGVLSLEFGKAILEVGWKFHQTLIWAKNNHALGRMDYHNKHEPLIYGWKGSREDRTWMGGRDKMSLLAYDRPQANTEHPTMKPLELVVQLISNSAPNGSLGYDPFCGSGTTILAAQRVGVRVFAMELDPKYCDVIRKRWAGYCESIGLDPGPGVIK